MTVELVAAARPAQRRGDPVSHIQSLDGLRAISIALVLCSHLFHTDHFPHPPEGVVSFLSLGGTGVRVFFVISGFLITTLLMREAASSGRVSLRRFYFRRTMRIFPPYYAYVAVVALLSSLHVWVLRDHDILAALTYTVNYHLDRSWVLGHAWSLSVEEQFYLLWPAIMVLAGRRRALSALTAYVAAAPLLRLVALKLVRPHLPFAIDEAFPTAADSIALGCVLAMSRERLITRPGYRWLMGSTAVTPALVFLAVLAAHALDRSATLMCVVGVSLENAAIAVLLDWVMRNPTGTLGRLLNVKPIAKLGTWSYSIYLWQQPFLQPQAGGLARTFPLNLALAVACAVISFYAIERPSLRLRARLEKRLQW